MSGQLLSFPKDFQLEDKFFRMAMAKFLREHHLPPVLFYELSPEQQSKILGDAQAFKDRAERASRRGHEGANRE